MDELESAHDEFADDLNSYLEFRHKCDPKQVGVDFEKFLGFLDVQHLLGLRGKDTWSERGNETQMIVKMLIGQILAEKMPRELPDVVSSLRGNCARGI